MSHLTSHFQVYQCGHFPLMTFHCPISPALHRPISPIASFDFQHHGPYPEETSVYIQSQFITYSRGIRSNFKVVRTERNKIPAVGLGGAVSRQWVQGSALVRFRGTLKASQIHILELLVYCFPGRNLLSFSKKKAT